MKKFNMKSVVATFLCIAATHLSLPAFSQSITVRADEYKPDVATVQVGKDASQNASIATLQNQISDAVKTNDLPLFSVKPGQRLSKVLSEWLKKQDVNISWEAQGTLPGRIRDVEIESTWVSQSKKIDETLEQILKPFGFVAEIVQPSEGMQQTTLVVVRNATGNRP